ncbi:hypothetical protein K7432_006962 [Basidiobolus ranarum]|uniref:Vacuolar membrane protein n=1 Tax=Basidiobolus ranarum TaxID=34480 RepID=A0ABR2W128_9FUNG
MDPLLPDLAPPFNTTPPPYRERMAQCSLTDDFALIVQAFLAFTAFSTLLLKRQKENPRRPLLIWFFDTSKQGFAACFVHFFNVFLSYASLLADEQSNPCDWYFLNVFMDTTFGVATMYFLIKFSNNLIHRYKWYELRIGEYGHPPDVLIWLRQLGWFIGMSMVNKLLLLVIYSIPFVLPIVRALLAPFRPLPKIEVVFVMLLFPLVMNIMQFWLIDQLLKEKFMDSTLDDDREVMEMDDAEFLLEDDEDDSFEKGKERNSQEEGLEEGVINVTRRLTQTIY